MCFKFCSLVLLFDAWVCRVVEIRPRTSLPATGVLDGGRAGVQHDGIGALLRAARFFDASGMPAFLLIDAAQYGQALPAFLPVIDTL